MMCLAYHDGLGSIYKLIVMHEIMQKLNLVWRDKK